MEGTGDTEQDGAAAVRVVRELTRKGATLGVAESITGGRVASAITAVSGSSAVFVGGVVSYATRVKIDLLGVPESTVTEHGVVSQECAGAMAEGVRRLLGTTYGVATTGVAGPGPSEGTPPGTVWVAIAGPRGCQVHELSLDGDRGQVQDGATKVLMELLAREALDREVSTMKSRASGSVG